MRSLPRIGGTSSSSSRRGSKIRARCHTTFFLEKLSHTKRLVKVGKAACEWHALYAIVARRVLTNTTLQGRENEFSLLLFMGLRPAHCNISVSRPRTYMILLFFFGGGKRGKYKEHLLISPQKKNGKLACLIGVGHILWYVVTVYHVWAGYLNAYFVCRLKNPS